MLSLTLPKRLLLLFLIFLVGLFIVGALSAIVGAVFGSTTPSMRIIAVLQDVVMFIVPAIATAMMVTRRPASLLCVDRPPQLRFLLVAVGTLIVSIPAMNYVIWLNNNIPLPAGLETALRSLEDNAEATIELLNGPHTVPNLLMTVLIVGVFAGLSEEILFRGGLQRLLVTGRVNPHAAIWVTAAVFSLMHLQFFGFVPRLLLGAFFGYALWYSGSLWISVILHTLNNTVYVIGEWCSYGNTGQSPGDSIGSGGDYAIVAVSAVLVACGLILMHRERATSGMEV